MRRRTVEGGLGNILEALCGAFPYHKAAILNDTGVLSPFSL